MDNTSINEQDERVFVTAMPDMNVTLQTVLRHPATWMFGLIWLIALVILLITGYSSLLPVRLAIVIGLIPLSLGTVALTKGHAPAFAERPHSVLALWLQLSLIIAVIFFTVIAQPLIYNVIARFHYSIIIINPALYFILPVILLLPLGVRLRELNMGKGWHSWRVTVLWSIPLLILLTIAMIGGSKTGSIANKIIGNAFQNGFFEEFLWRGALMSRLRLLVGNPWSIVLSSLLFGLWHTQANASSGDGNLLAAMALSIINQASIGLGFAIIVYRTRNLLASSIVHVLWDTTFQALG